MRISSSFNTIKTDNAYNQSFKGVPQNPVYIPEIIGNLGKIAGKHINAPEQKLFLATFGLMFQPLIDLKFAKDDKKIDSSIKTASKLMAGGITGVTIRAAFLKLTDKYIGLDKHNIFNRLFMPFDAIENSLNDRVEATIRMNQYSKALGTLLAIATMVLFTNKRFDVPLTNDFQDLLSGVIKENKSWLQSINDVSVNRKNKIKSWIQNKINKIVRIKETANKVADVIKSNNESEQKAEKETKK